LALQPDGKVLVGGQFYIDGTTNQSVFRLNSNGSLNSSFTASGEIFAVYSLGLQADGIQSSRAGARRLRRFATRTQLAARVVRPFSKYFLAIASGRKT